MYDIFVAPSVSQGGDFFLFIWLLISSTITLKMQKNINKTILL